MTEINLSRLNLKHFTESNAQLYCQLSLINPNNIKQLYLSFNQLTDISGISIFKNIETLYLYNNKIKDLSSLINLINLDVLNLTDKLKTVNILKKSP